MLCCFLFLIQADIRSICIFFCNCSAFLSLQVNIPKALCIQFFCWLIWYAMHLLYCCLQIKQLLNSHGFLDYWEREVLVMMKTIIIFMTSYKTQLEGVPISILPSSLVEPKFLTISHPYIEILGKFNLLMYLNMWNWYKYTLNDFII